MARYASVTNQFGQPDWAKLLEGSKGKAGKLAAALKDSRVQQVGGGGYVQMPKPKKGESYSPGEGLVPVGTTTVSSRGTNHQVTVYGKAQPTQSQQKSQQSTSSSNNKNKNNNSGGGGSYAAPSRPASDSPYAWDPMNAQIREAAARSLEFSRRAAADAAPVYSYAGYLDDNGEPSFDNGTNAAAAYGNASRKASDLIAKAFDDQARLEAIEWGGVSSGALSRADFSPPDVKDPMTYYDRLKKDILKA